jgi:hypothetical protein
LSKHKFKHSKNQLFINLKKLINANVLVFFILSNKVFRSVEANGLVLFVIHVPAVRSIRAKKRGMPLPSGLKKQP